MLPAGESTAGVLPVGKGVDQARDLPFGVGELALKLCRSYCMLNWQDDSVAFSSSEAVLFSVEHA